MGRVLKPAAGSSLAFFLPMFWLIIGDVVLLLELDDDSPLSF
jgi:hypothetical protein